MPSTLPNRFYLSYRPRVPVQMLQLVLCAALLSNCTSAGKLQKKNTAAADIAANDTSIALGDPAGTTGGKARTPIILEGTGQLVRPPSIQSGPNVPQTAPIQRADGFQLSFVDTEIATVVASVIGEGLGLPYLVDAQVKGTITLQATRPLGREEVIPALEAALRIQGAAVVNVNGVYNVVPIKDAPRRVTGLRGQADTKRDGFGIQIVPLRYVSVGDMEKALRPFAPDGAILRTDESRNLLLLAGTSQELATMLDVVQTFDVDWLAGMSFGLYPLEYSDPKTVADELGQVFADAKTPIANVVRIIP